MSPRKLPKFFWSEFDPEVVILASWCGSLVSLGAGLMAWVTDHDVLVAASITSAVLCTSLSAVGMRWATREMTQKAADIKEETETVRESLVDQVVRTASENGTKAAREEILRYVQEAKKQNAEREKDLTPETKEYQLEGGPLDGTKYTVPKGASGADIEIGGEDISDQIVRYTYHPASGNLRYEGKVP